MPIGVGKDVLAQVMTDETIDPKNEYIIQNKPLPKLDYGGQKQKSTKLSTNNFRGNACEQSQLNASGWRAKTGGTLL
jgi:hypothetical protein